MGCFIWGIFAVDSAEESFKQVAELCFAWELLLSAATDSREFKIILMDTEGMERRQRKSKGQLENICPTRTVPSEHVMEDGWRDRTKQSSMEDCSKGSRFRKGKVGGKKAEKQLMCKFLMILLNILY